VALEIGHEAAGGVGRGPGDGLDSGPMVLDADVEPLTIAGASARLGIAPDAVRKRIRRGSLRAIKVDGCWRVLLGAEEAAAGTPDADVQAATRAAAWTGRRPTGHEEEERGSDGVQAAARMPIPGVQAAVQDGPTVEAYRELVASLRDQVGFLRQELETRSRELEGRAEEVRRRDALLDAMAQRLRQLPTPVDQPDEYRTVIQAAVVPAEEVGRLKAELEQAQQRVAEFEAVTDELEREREAAAAGAARRPWWRFWE
jgi:hypothetical protein